MHFKQKLTYMALGCLFTIIGYILASLSGNPVDAQPQADKSEPTVVDEVVCRKLRVVNDDGETVVLILDSSVFSDSSGGGLIVLDHPDDIYGGVWIRANSDGGSMEVFHASGETALMIGVAANKGGVIQVQGTDDKSGIQLGINEYGGQMAIFNKGRKGVLQAGVSNMGGGIIITNDKNGYKTGQLP